MHIHKHCFLIKLISGGPTDTHLREFAIARMTVFITLAFIVLNIPYVVYNYYASEASSNFLYSFGFFMLITIDRLFTGLNMLVNLITYSILSTNFRNTVKDMFLCNKQKKKSSTIRRLPTVIEETSQTVTTEVEVSLP